MRAAAHGCLPGWGGAYWRCPHHPFVTATIVIHMATLHVASHQPRPLSIRALYQEDLRKPPLQWRPAAAITGPPYRTARAPRTIHTTLGQPPTTNQCSASRPLQPQCMPRRQLGDGSRHTWANRPARMINMIWASTAPSPGCPPWLHLASIPLPTGRSTASMAWGGWPSSTFAAL